MQKRFVTVLVLLTSLLFITANYGEDISDLSNANFSELPFFVNLRPATLCLCCDDIYKEKRKV
jgi:hypothetical protein